VKRNTEDHGHAVVNIFGMEFGKFVEHCSVLQSVSEKYKN